MNNGPTEKVYPEEAEEVNVNVNWNVTIIIVCLSLIVIGRMLNAID